MASILNTAAQRINADTAGRTSTPEPNPGAPSGATPAEMLHSVITTASGSLDSMFRQEPVLPAAASPQAVQATSAVRGPHGGLVPAALSRLRTGMDTASPGPGPTTGAVTVDHGTPAAGLSTVAATAAADTRTSLTNAVAFVRRRLGV